MRLALALIACATAVAVWPSPRRAAVRGSPVPNPQRRGGSSVVPSLLVARLIAVVACGVLLGFPWGWGLGALVWWVLPRGLARLESAHDRTREVERRRALPLAADLLATAWEAGAAPVLALDSVGRSVAGPLGDDVVQVAARMALGASAAEAWAGWVDRPDGAAVARALMRSESSGTAPTDALRRAARQAREHRRRDGEAVARRAAVRAAAPLGLCFLPAFVLLGIAPVVMAALGPLMAS